MNDTPRSSVWVLTDERAGNRTQAVGLADALGLDYAIQDLRFGFWSKLHIRLLGASIIGLKRADQVSLAPPWPYLILAAGRRTAPVARWIKLQNNGQTQIVQLGRKGGQDPSPFDAVVTPIHAGLPAHPKRVETLGPLNRVSTVALTEAAHAVSPFDGQPKPWVSLMVGGATTRQQLGPAEARILSEQVARATTDLSGTLIVVTSPRTGPKATAAFIQAVGDRGLVIPWRANESFNPYLSCLAQADIIVVTGDSESMIAEAAASGKAAYVYTLPIKPASAWLRIGSRAHALAVKGGAEGGGLIAKIYRVLVDSGLLRPPRDMALLHTAMDSRGYVKIFRGKLTSQPPPVPIQETARVAETLRTMLKLDRV